MGKNASFRIKFIAFVSLFISILIACITFIFVRVNISSAINIFGDSGRSVVQVARDMINGDKFERLAASLDKNDPFYEETCRALHDLKLSSSSEFLYTMAPKSDDIYYYIIDGSADPSDRENFSALGEEEDISSFGAVPKEAMSKNKITISPLERDDRWGWVISVYAPITNNSGRAVGFVGCDFNAAPVVSLIKKSIMKAVSICICLLIAAIVSILLFMHPFFRNIEKITDAMRQIAQGEGDLTLRVEHHSQDEIGQLAQSCNAVTERLRSIIDSLKTSVSSLSVTGESVHKQTEETVSTIKEAGGTMQAIKDQATDQARTTSNVYGTIKSVEAELTSLQEKLDTQSKALQSSSDAIAQLSDSITYMNGQVNNITEQHEMLVTATKNGRQIQESVREKMKLIVAEAKNLTDANAAINAIAERTNLLAMNASIEAAHAGELGKGFSVVAEEIRHLAETSAKQSAAIKDLIDNIQDSIRAIVDANRLSAQSYTDISDRVATIDSLMLEVRGGMNEQQLGTQTILEKIDLINMSTASIHEASQSMATENQSLFSGIDVLQSQSTSILDSVVEANENLHAIQQIAEKNGAFAKQNLTISTNVNALVNRFKTKLRSKESV